MTTVHVLIDSLFHSGPTDEVVPFSIDSGEDGQVEVKVLGGSPEERTFTFNGDALADAVYRATITPPCKEPVAVTNVVG